MFDTHLLIPSRTDYVPSSDQVLGFFQHLLKAGVLSSPPRIRLRMPTDEDVFARNPHTGKKIPLGKRLKDVPVAEFAAIEQHIVKGCYYILTLEGLGLVSSSPFELYEKDCAKPDPARIFRTSVKCLLRDRRTQLSEPWHEHARTFLLPMEKAKTHAPGAAPSIVLTKRFSQDFGSSSAATDSTFQT
ncbi:MAG: hypothetical protein ABR956_07660 [Terracidiphilus sp.]|jgi:hypothetical protein